MHAFALPVRERAGDGAAYPDILRFGVTPLYLGFVDVWNAVDQLLQVLSGRVFTAHNARFDWGFVDAEVKRTRGLALVGSRMCTVRLARALLPELPSRGLDALQEYFNIPNLARHRARGDALATADLLEKLLTMARERNCRTLADVEAMIQLGRKR